MRYLNSATLRRTETMVFATVLIILMKMSSATPTAIPRTAAYNPGQFNHHGSALGHFLNPYIRNHYIQHYQYGNRKDDIVLYLPNI